MSYICFKNSKSRANVSLVSPIRPKTKLRPGRSSDKPLSPLFEPTSFKSRIALIISSGDALRLFFLITTGSTLSTPNAATSPEV